MISSFTIKAKRGRDQLASFRLYVFGCDWMALDPRRSVALCTYIFNWSSLCSGTVFDSLSDTMNTTFSSHILGLDPICNTECCPMWRQFLSRSRLTNLPLFKESVRHDRLHRYILAPIIFLASFSQIWEPNAFFYILNPT